VLDRLQRELEMIKGRERIFKNLNEDKIAQYCKGYREAIKLAISLREHEEEQVNGDERWKKKITMKG